MNIIEFIEDRRFLNDQSLSLPQKTVLKVMYGLDLNREEKAVYSKLTGLDRYRKREYNFAVGVAGRRSGKTDKWSSTIGIFEGVMRDHSQYLSVGERAYVLVIASSLRQARVLFSYISGKLKNSEILSNMIVNETQFEISLSNKVTIGIFPPNQKYRGLSVVCAVLDECAYFRDQGVLVDTEIVNGIKPALITFPHSKLFLVSSPSGKRGIIWESYRDHYGKDTDTLVMQGSSDYFNPKIKRSFIKQELEKDRTFASQEYEAVFVDNLTDFISPETLELCINRGVYEIAFRENMNPKAFVDMSGGSHDDSVLCASSLLENGTIEQLFLRAIKSPHSPLKAIEEFSKVLKSYNLFEVTGDSYASGFNRETWQQNGVNYIDSERSKSEIYLEMLPLINTQTVSLLDDPETMAQFRSLERRRGRVKDVVDHPRGQKDDRCNAVSGSTILCKQDAVIDSPLWILGTKGYDISGDADDPDMDEALLLQDMDENQPDVDWDDPYGEKKRAIAEEARRALLGSKWGKGLTLEDMED